MSIEPVVAPERDVEQKTTPGAVASITVCPDGPLLVRGPVELLSVDGEAVEHYRRVVALCRCGRSRLKPLCDGSHRLNRFRDSATADQMSQVLNRARPVPPE
ncbi:MAG TPA: CDGSH iron-sulfur domain-containing protein [Microlunatus sp.]